VIEAPLNDRGCLGDITATMAAMVEADDPSVAEVAASSNGVAQSGQGSEPSSTHNHTRTRLTRSRIASIAVANVPWNTTAITSALSHRYTNSSAA